MWFVLSTNQKGAIAESAITAAAIKLGVGVFKPVMDERYDVIFDLRPRLLRVQCKWAVRVGDVVVVRCYSCRRSANGLLRRSYTDDEVDAIAAYCLDLDRCYLLPMGDVGARRQICLRLDGCRNNQQLGVNWAADFELAATLSRLEGP